ncbi:Cation/H(+) antiporter 15 [Apostasia shenzhenica]|uniref:Cation/H(+) antiporter 15 n=1 Tax=Apostasia shenzhenica TaxID=1088818 RepID=A0A2I0AWP1_9ASPA|nr:Cation/H(+) antiporter 15 [Apostasia shenzhenica]
MTTSAGIWLADNPLMFSLPLLLYQITLIFFFSRITHSILRHLSIPVVISQITAGIILGPSCLGRHKAFESLLFAPRSWEQLNTISLLSFMLFVFIIGLKTDLGMIPKSGKKAFAIAICSSFLPFCLVILIAMAIKNQIPQRFREKFVLLNLGSSWSLTSYAVVSCVLAELNLLTSKLGRLAMSATLITEFTYLLLSTMMGSYILATNQGITKGMISLGSFVAFMSFLVFVARPLTIKAIRRASPEGKMLGEASFVGVILLAMACGLISEAIGYHATAGPFLLGLILPGGTPLAVTMVEKLERLVVGVFLPVFLASAGLRMDVTSLGTIVGEWSVLLAFLLLAIAGKFTGVLIPCLYCKMPLRDCLAVGLMMISKGISEIGSAMLMQDSKHKTFRRKFFNDASPIIQILDQQLFTVVVLVVVLVGGGSAPLVKHTYRPEDRFVTHKRRSVQFLKPNTELRLLACLHGHEHVNPILTLLRSSHPSLSSPVCLYALLLKPLTGRAAALLLPYDRRRPPATSAGEAADTDSIFNAFLHAEQLFSGCSILPYLCISPYASMHDDICSLALDKKVSLIIIPFHKHIAVDGFVAAPVPAVRSVNTNVLCFAPCSVAILIDHGLAGDATAFRSGNIVPHAAVYFFGGADDREALAVGLRMAEDPAVGLTVVRFRGTEAAAAGDGAATEDERMLEEVRMRRADGSRVVYREEVVRDGEGTVGVIREISARFGLLVVGRGERKETTMTSGLSMWSEYPELGIVGDLLASTDFGGRVSTLVVQQQRRFAGASGPAA